VDEQQGQLIAEQLARFGDKVDARINALEAKLEAYQALENERSSNVKQNIADLKNTGQDHEARIRAVTEATTKNQVVLGLASGGSSLMAVVAFLKAWFGGP
jgi:hypothetical protein